MRDLEAEAIDLARTVSCHSELSKLERASLLMEERYLNGEAKPPEGVSLELAIGRLRVGVHSIRLAKKLYVQARTA